MYKNVKINVKYIILILICLFFSCSKEEKSVNDFTTDENNYFEIFLKLNENKPEVIYPIEYYKNKIIENQKLFPEQRPINVITEIKDIIPGLLCFLVGWNDFNIGRGQDYDIDWGNNPRGNFFGLYTFDNDQNYVNEYVVGHKHYIDSVRNQLMEKLPGSKLSYGMVSYGDFNDDGMNEILSVYLHPPQYEYVFTVFGYNIMENDFIPILMAPVQLNFEPLFLGVEYLGDGFRILEVIDYQPLELVWNNYIWDKKIGKYIKRLDYGEN